MSIVRGLGDMTVLLKPGVITTVAGMRLFRPRPNPLFLLSSRLAFSLPPSQVTAHHVSDVLALCQAHVAALEESRGAPSSSSSGSSVTAAAGTRQQQVLRDLRDGGVTQQLAPLRRAHYSHHHGHHHTNQQQQPSSSPSGGLYGEANAEDVATHLGNVIEHVLRGKAAGTAEAPSVFADVAV